MNTNDYQTVLRILDKTLEQHLDLNSYEKSTIFRMKGAAHLELDHISEAIKAFEDAINADGFSGTEPSTLCKNIAQLRIKNGEYERVPKLLEKCVKDKGVWDKQRVGCKYMYPIRKL